MNLRIDPAVLDDAASNLDQIAHHIGAATTYLPRVDGQGSIFTTLVQRHQDMLTNLESWLGKLQTLANGSRTALTAAAGYYRGTDIGAAARFDAALPDANPGTYPGADHQRVS
ncbi:type VII secretion target [Dactylosporangium sp. CA-139066]|uniref:type VII secretion target n=1 Tax=Dactylosporangium sp. CA-139066 TaxID=3239930 RepID=UPI003D8F89C4